MIKISVYDLEAEQIGKLADAFDATNAEVVSALLDMLENEAYLLGKDTSEILEEYM